MNDMVVIFSYIPIKNHLNLWCTGPWTQALCEGLVEFTDLLVVGYKSQ